MRLREIAERNQAKLIEAGYETEEQVQAMFKEELRAVRLEAFRRAADTTGAEAQKNGWNDELNEALLRGDLDGSEDFG